MVSNQIYDIGNEIDSEKLCLQQFNRPKHLLFDSGLLGEVCSEFRFLERIVGDVLHNGEGFDGDFLPKITLLVICTVCAIGAAVDEFGLLLQERE